VLAQCHVHKPALILSLSAARSLTTSSPVPVVQNKPSSQALPSFGGAAKHFLLAVLHCPSVQGPSKAEQSLLMKMLQSLAVSLHCLVMQGFRVGQKRSLQAAALRQEVMLDSAGCFA
jgi:hypothetical protein